MAELDDPQKLNRKETRFKMKTQRELGDIGFVMSSPEGRRFVKWVIDLTGHRKLSYSGPGKEQDTAFYEGQRNVGNKIVAIIEDNFPEEQFQMMEEYRNEEKK